MKTIIVNAVTGERVERDLTAEELAEREAFEAEAEARQAEIAAEEQAREERKASVIEKLGALGLTPDEVADVFGLEVQQ